MSEPRDIFDVVCDLDRLIEALRDLGYWDEAESLRAAQERITGGIVLSAVSEQGA